MEQNIVDMVFNRAGYYQNKDVLLFKPDPVSSYKGIAWNEFSGNVIETSAALSNLGIKKGEKVALFSENRPEWIFADLGILSLGAVSVPIYPTSSVPDIKFILNHSEAGSMFVSSGALLKKLIEESEIIGRLSHIVVFDEVNVKNDKVIPFDSFKKSADGNYEEHEKVFHSSLRSVGRDDLASIIYTSGTTGQPKGVMLTHKNILTNCAASKAAVPMTEKDVSLSFLPLSHVFERVAGFYLQVMSGMTVAFAESFDTIASNLKEIRPTIACSVPRFFEKIRAKILQRSEDSGFVKKIIFRWAVRIGRKVAKIRNLKRKMPFVIRLQYALAKRLVFNRIRESFGGRLKFFISGGAALPKQVAEFFYAAGILILEGYGLTEASPVVSVNRCERNKFGTVGVPLDGVEVKIADDGEILVRGPNVMRGYYKNPRATSESVRDGWLYTGDVGRWDKEEFLKITDRKKEIIVTSGGKNVSPLNIETFLQSDEFIAQAMVCGDRKKYLSALVVPNFEQVGSYCSHHKIDITSRVDMCENKRVTKLFRKRIDEKTKDLAMHEQIRVFKLLPEEFTVANGELTPTLKIRRKVISSRYRNVIAEMYE